MPRKKNKENQQLSLSADVRQMLKEQADEIGISVSMYVERLILEKNWEKHNRNNHKS